MPSQTTEAASPQPQELECSLNSAQNLQQSSSYPGKASLVEGTPEQSNIQPVQSATKISSCGSTTEMLVGHWDGSLPDDEEGVCSKSHSIAVVFETDHDSMRIDVLDK